jgi:hypothetical protein
MAGEKNGYGSLDEAKHDQNSEKKVLPTGVSFIAAELEEQSSKIGDQMWGVIYRDYYGKILDGIKPGMTHSDALQLCTSIKAKIKNFSQHSILSAALSSSIKEILTKLHDRLNLYVTWNYVEAPEAVADKHQAVKQVVAASVAQEEQKVQEKQQEQQASDLGNLPLTQGQTALFGDNIFISDFLTNLNNKMNVSLFESVREKIYDPIFLFMKTFVINEKQEISGRSSLVQDLNGLYRFVNGELQDGLNESLKGIDPKVIAEISASLDALKSRLLLFISWNYPKYVKSHNEQFSVQAAAIKSHRVEQGKEYGYMFLNALICPPATACNVLLNFVLCGAVCGCGGFAADEDFSCVGRVERSCIVNNANAARRGDDNVDDNCSCCAPICNTFFKPMSHIRDSASQISKLGEQVKTLQKNGPALQKMG